MSFREEIKALLEKSDLDEADRAFLTAWMKSDDPELHINVKDEQHIVQEAMKARRLFWRKDGKDSVAREKLIVDNRRIANEAQKLKDLAKASEDAAAVYRDLEVRNHILVSIGSENKNDRLRYPALSYSDMARMHEESAVNLRAAARDVEHGHVRPGHKGGDGWGHSKFARAMADAIETPWQAEGLDATADSQDRAFVAALTNLVFGTSWDAADVARARNSDSRSRGRNASA
jgi:hypothetical protein